MKKINLLNRLLSYSHEKQSPQRFARYAVMLIMLLTLGVGQMWAESVTYDGNQWIYFNVQDNNWKWTNDGCKIFAVFDDSHWTSQLSQVIGDVYGAKIPAGTYSKVDFVRQSSDGKTEHNRINDKALESGKNYWYANGSVWGDAELYYYLADKTIYFNNKNTNWGTPYFRIGRTNYADNTAMTKVNGTLYLWSYTRNSNWENYHAFTVTNGSGASDNIYTVSPATYSTENLKYNITETSNYISTSGSPTDGYYSTSFQTSLPNYAATISTPTNGTLTVYKYTATSYETDKNSSNNFSAISNGDATSKPTQIIKIVPAANSGYSLSELSVSGAEKIEDVTGGSTYYVTGDFEISATFVPDWALYNYTTKLADFEKISSTEYHLSFDLNRTTHLQLQFKKDGTQGYIVGAEDPTSTFRNLTLSDGYFSWANIPGVTTASYFITLKYESSTWKYKAEQKYTLTYDANGATSGSAPTDANSPYAPNTAVTTASNSGSLAKTSFTLTGWNTKADGSGTHYNLNTSNAFNINSNMTLYAEWTPDVPSSACVAGDFGTATMTKTTAGSVTTFTYTFYDKAEGTYDFYLDNCSGSAVLKATTGITMSQTGCTSIDNSGDANNYFRVVTGSAGDVTITATYNTSTMTINMDVKRVDIDAVASSSWYMIGGPFNHNWNANNTSFPLNRRYRGMSDVDYRVVDFGDGTKYFKLSDGSNVKCTSNISTNTEIELEEQYELTTNTQKSFTIDHDGAVYCVYDKTNNKFWVQNPTVYHTVSVTNTGSHGTVVLKEKSYGGLTTNKFASGETIRIEIDTTAHYSIASVRLDETNVTMSHSEGTKYVGDVVMPNSDATLTVTYTPWYTVTYGVGTSYTSMGGVSHNKTISSGNYIISGTSMTFTATPELGYKFVGWYREAACESEVSTDNPYTFSVSSTTTLYAKFAYRDLYIQADWLGWSTALMTQSTVNRAVYTYEIDNVAARETSASSPYNNGYHFRFMNANNGGNDYLAYNYDGVQTPTGSGFLTNSDIHKTYVDNPTIQYNLTHKSKITITLTLQSIDDATKPTVNIAADRYYDISYTSPSHGSYTIQVGAAAAVSEDTDARAGTTITLANSPATGYHFDSWTVETVSVSNDQFSMPAEDVTVSASFAATSYDVALDANTGTGAGVTVSATYDAAMPDTDNASNELVAPTKTGYTFTGYWDAKSSGTKYYNANLSSAHIWDKATTSTLYAQWSARSYTITLTQEGETGYGSAGDEASVTATYDATMPTLGDMPTGTIGYKFQGYYSDHNGMGSKLVNADGTWNNVTDTISAGKYVCANNLTLYAYFKNAEIATLPLSTTLVHPWVSAGTKDSIDVEPTLTFTPEGSVHIDYVIQYYDGSTVTDDGLQSYRRLSGDNIRFRAPSAPGSYRLHAVLKTGSTLGEGDELDTENAAFVVASNHNVTVRYVCDGKTIRQSDNYSINAIDSTSISAPSIARYTFSNWSATEGISSNTADNVNPKKYVASFDGTITATYVEKPIVYFKNNLNWGDVWVTYDAAWNDTYGTGSNGKTYRHMTHIEGTDIWYDEIPSTYTENGFANWAWNIAFNSEERHEDHFSVGKVIYRRDFDPYNTFFVPAPDSIVSPFGKAGSSSYQSSVAPDFTDAVGKNYLYTGGYWKRYNSTYSGWSLRGEFNSWEGSNHNFVAASSDDSIFTTSVLLYKNQTKQFRLYKNKMKNGISDAYTNYGYNITLQNSETARRFTPPGNANNSDSPSGYYHNTTVQSATEGVYVFKIHYTYKGTVELTIDFPMHAGDYEVAYKDNEKTDWHTSGTIDRNATESTRSFFVRTDQTPVVNWRKSKTVSDAGAIEWYDWNAVSLGDYTKSGAILESNAEKNGVYNFKFNIADNALSLTDVEKYNGAYYIRTDAAGGKKWADYISDDHYMTYSDYADSYSGFSHYFMKFVGANTNVKFLVANPYSPCISDTLGQGTQSNYVNSSDLLIESANIRFMWNMHDNSLDRAYVGMVDRTIPRSATKFIVLQGQDGMLMDSEGDELNSTNQGRMYVGDNAIEFDDDQSWIYETTVKAKANGKIKIYSRVNGHDHYLVGKSPIDDWTTSDAYDVLINGTGDDAQVIRVIYDFKTGRLMAAWVPSGVISEDMKNLKADIMIKRKHQESATSFSIAAGKKITLDEEKHKTIYGVMTFNKNILNNRNESTGSPLDEGDQKSVYERSNYYISFPFDVNVSDIFGFGSYGPDWTLRYYDGKGRAKNGYWADSESFWKWVPPFGTLNAGQGYLLSLNLNNFKTTASFWDNGVENIELYFPATGKIDIRQMDHFDIDSLKKAEYESTVWRGRETGAHEGDPNYDRRIADSYWRCIGVPSFAPYKNDSIYNEENSKIVWTTEANTLPYFYAVNWGDGSLEVKSSAENAIELLPMHGYMVQNKGIIRWHYVSKPVPSSIVARHHNYVQDVEFRLELLKNDIKEDQAFIRLSNNEDVTNAFDFNQDLSKELNEGANIYTLVGMERLAANSMPFSEQTMTIPVGVRIAADGEYTFTMPEGTSGIGVTLIDNVTGARTSMSMTDYTVNLTAGDYNGRFSIEISPVSEVLTDIETVSDEGFEMNRARKVIVDGILYIVKDDIIYDARGNKVQ